MTSAATSGTQFFWPNISLESVERECTRTGDTYRTGSNDGVQGYWITVSKTPTSKGKSKLEIPTSRRDHRVRSASPLLSHAPATQRRSENGLAKDGKTGSTRTTSSNHATNDRKRAPTRRLSAVLLRHLERSSADDSKSIWEGIATGARHEYIQGDLLGKGSFGEVRKASVKGYEGSVARKSMFLQSRKRRDVQKEKDRIQREVENLQRARHEHVVNILDCYAEREKNFTTYYLIMSPVGDQDLETLLEKFPRMPATDREKCKKRMCKWFTCLASALAYMHKEGIRHEDIKPSNIIHRGGTIYFTDFSSSRVFQPDFETATTSTVQATRRFAPPEVLDTFNDEIHIRSGNAIKTTGKDGKTIYEVPHGSQSDVFSLGLVFAEMTTVFQKTITEMHDFVLVLENSTRKPLYHEVIDRLGNWFNKELKSGRGLKLWTCCLRSMLREKRTSRPSALSIVHILQREEPVGKVVDDGCQALLPPAPKTRSSKPQRTGQEGAVSKDEKPAVPAVNRRNESPKSKDRRGSDTTKPDSGNSRKRGSGGNAAKQTQTEKNHTPKKK